MGVKSSKVVLERVCKAGDGVMVLYKNDFGQQGATVEERTRHATTIKSSLDKDGSKRAAGPGTGTITVIRCLRSDK